MYKYPALKNCTNADSQGTSKKRKLSSHPKGASKTKIKAKEKSKEKASDKKTIPIPTHTRDSDEDSELSDQDMDFLEEYGGSVNFLTNLDQNGISRSKKETIRLHALNKPVRKAVEDDLPSIDSDGEDDEESWSSGIEDLPRSQLGSTSDTSLDDDASGSTSGSSLDSDTEMPYESAPRKRRPSWDPAEENNINHLPTKLADGRIKKSISKPTAVISAEKHGADDEDEDDEDPDLEEREERYRVEDVSTGARFGRPAVVDVIGSTSRKARIQGAKDQIAGICQEIISDPENSVSLRNVGSLRYTLAKNLCSSAY